MRSSAIRWGLAVAVVAGVLGLAACGGSDDDPFFPPVITTGAVEGTVFGVFPALNVVLDDYVTLVVTRVGGGAGIEIPVEDDGTFSRTLTAGTYNVLASRPGYENLVSAGAFTVAAGATATYEPGLTALEPNTYIKSASCGVCHETRYDEFLRAGHTYKLNKVSGNTAPTYPFSDISGSLALLDDDDQDIDGGLADPRMGVDNIGSGEGTPNQWSDITYVIGGYYWKNRFCGSDGWVVTGTSVQYNLPRTDSIAGPIGDTMVAYHNNEEKPYNCGNCHTTGWGHTDALLNDNRQDGLNGMDGTFSQGGVHCEACHGAGATHAQTMMAGDITRLATPRTTAQLLQADQGVGRAIACGECHTRDGEQDYPTYISSFNAARMAAGEATVAMGGRTIAKGGLAKHHEQYDDLLGIDPEDPKLASTRSPGFMATHGNCLTCHNPHTTTVYQDESGDAPGVQKSNDFCMGCHPTKNPADANTNGMQGLQCIDCHMPKLAKSALATTLDNGVVIGDVATHVFSINLKSTYNLFTDGGGYMNPAIDYDHACKTCHGNTEFAIDFIDQDTYQFHQDD